MFDFIKIGEVPKTSWSSEETFNLKPRLKTLMALVVGLILFGLGEALLVTSQIGVSPWTALGQGLANISELQNAHLCITPLTAHPAVTQDLYSDLY